MKALILYRPNSEHGRIVEEFVHDFKNQEPSRKVDVISIDTKEGASTAQLYDVVQYPAVLALANDGQMLKMWQGQMPMMNELASYTLAS